MLTDKLNEQDRWAHWALSTAQSSRDKVERAKNNLDLNIEMRQNCWGITYLVCAYTMNNRVAAARWALSVAVPNFIDDLEATGKPLVQRAKLLNIPLPNPNSLQMSTYEIK